MKKQSVTITVFFVFLFAVALVGLLFTAPMLVEWFSEFRGLNQYLEDRILLTVYVCAVPAAIALYCLWRLLWNIRAEQIFVSQNNRLLGLISWCCLAVTGVTLVASHYYMPFALVSVAMLFIFLIVRVVRGCMLAGTLLREENSLTI